MPRPGEDHHPLRIGALNSILRLVSAHNGARRENYPTLRMSHALPPEMTSARESLCGMQPATGKTDGRNRQKTLVVPAILLLCRHRTRDFAEALC